MIFLEKIHENMIFSSNVLKRSSFQKKKKKKKHWNMIFLVLSEKISRKYFFPGKHDILFGRKMKDDLSQEIHGYMISSVYTYRCYKHDVMPICQEKDDLLPQRYT